MKTVKVKKLWKGMIAVRDKYVTEALRSKDGLMVEVQEPLHVYLISNEMLAKPHAKTRVPDKFSRDVHTLCYYKVGKPMKPTQGKLID